MRVAVTTAAAAITLLTAGVGAAASLEVLGGDLGAGTADVLDCDPNGVTVHLLLGAGNALDVVEIGDIDAACVGHTLHVDIKDATGAILESLTGTASSPATSLTAAGATLEKDVEHVAVAMAP